MFILFIPITWSVSIYSYFSTLFEGQHYLRISSAFKVESLQETYRLYGLLKDEHWKKKTLEEAVFSWLPSQIRQFAIMLTADEIEQPSLIWFWITICLKTFWIKPDYKMKICPLNFSQKLITNISAIYPVEFRTLIVPWLIVRCQSLM